MSKSEEDKSVQSERNQADDAQRRADGEAFDERMRELTSDPPRPARPAQEHRRRR